MWLVVLLIAYFLYAFLRNEKLSVYIIVLGDIGRSPRMQYHAICFAEQGYRVHLIGYRGSPLMKEITDSSRVSAHYVPLFPAVGSESLHAFLKLVSSGVYLLFLCGLFLPRCDRIVIQTPPSIPTMFLVQIIRKLRRIRLIIDWHNLAFTLVDMKYRNPYLTTFSKM
jgi:beta-1,4-mannosyltransferase